MSDPTHDAPGTAHQAERRRRWLPTTLQLRLTFLMMAIVLGLTGMGREDPRLILTAAVFGIIGLLLRFVRPKGTKR